MGPFYLSKLKSHAPEDFGGKGNGLKRLLELGYPVPETLALSDRTWTESKKSVEALLKNISLESISYPAIVRSSANHEDGDDFSFAGAFLSLKIDEESDLRPAILKVIESILKSGDESVFQALGIDTRDLFPGFLIQSFIETKCRGVVFSRNPLDLWNKTALIEVSDRAGESVVDGTDSTQVFTEGHCSDPFLMKVFQVSHELEKSWGAPVDIEWGENESGNLILFQCRPIAGPEAKKVRLHLKNPDVVWSRELSQERFPECLSPLGWDVIRDGVPTNLRSVYEYFGLKTGVPEDLAFSDEGWIYNSTQFFKFPGGLKFDFRQFLKYRPLLFFSFMKGLSLAFLSFLFSFDRVKAKSIFSLVLSEGVIRPIESKTHEDFEKGKQAILELRKELPLFSQSTASKEELKTRMKRINDVAQVFLKTDFPIYLSKETLFKVYQKAWNDARSDISFLEVVSVLPKNISLSQIDHPEELEISRTSWDILHASVADQKNLFSSERPQPQRAKPDLVISSLWKRRIAQLQKWMEWDEELHHYTGVLIESSRRVLLNVGENLVQEKKLPEADSVFFLTLDEVKNYLDGIDEALSTRALFRKKRFELRKKSPPSLTLPPESQNQGEAPIGNGMSKGEAEASFQFLRHYQDYQEGSEEIILITHAPNPAWIPLFPKIVGWITETGGPLAHGFVAARDYGIPAVSHVDIESLIKKAEGKRIKLNGSTGTIEVIS